LTEYEAAVQYMRLSDEVRVLLRVGWDPGTSMLEGCGEALRQFDAIREGRPHIRRRKGWESRKRAA
jgi:hypothetical protein